MNCIKKGENKEISITKRTTASADFKTAAYSFTEKSTNFLFIWNLLSCSSFLASNHLLADSKAFLLFITLQSNLKSTLFVLFFCSTQLSGSSLCTLTRLVLSTSSSYLFVHLLATYAQTHTQSQISGKWSMTKYRKIFSCKNKKLAENKNFTLWQFSTTTTAWLTGTGFLCKKLTPGRHSGKKIKEHARAGLFIKVTSFIVTGSGTNQFSLFDCPLSKWRHILAPLRGKLKKRRKGKEILEAW